MRVLLFNDTTETWRRHAAGVGPEEIPPGTGDSIWFDGEAAFVKIWDGMFLVRGTKDVGFAHDVGESIGQVLELPTVEEE